MAEKDWAAILKNEDRIIANSDRRFRYHCYSLESMSEELTYKERSIYIQDDFTEQLMVEDFIDTVRNEKLFYPQIGVKPCSMAGGGVSKNIWNCFRTAPAWTGQPLTCSTTGMGLRLK